MDRSGGAFSGKRMVDYRDQECVGMAGALTKGFRCEGIEGLAERIGFQLPCELLCGRVKELVVAMACYGSDCSFI
jgi:hypothetical protein